MFKACIVFLMPKPQGETLHEHLIVIGCEMGVGTCRNQISPFWFSNDTITM